MSNMCCVLSAEKSPNPRIPLFGARGDLLPKGDESQLILFSARVLERQYIIPGHCFLQ